MKTTYTVSTTVSKSITIEDDFQYVLNLPPVKQPKKNRKDKRKNNRPFQNWSK